MRCWNCNREIPVAAKACMHCEAAVMPEPSAEEVQAARTLLDQLPPEAMADLQRAFLESETADDFTNSILVGNCPKCDSANTGDCEDDPEINEILVGRCFDCGQLWCTECDKLLTPKATVCECWDEDLPDSPDDDDE